MQTVGPGKFVCHTCSTIIITSFNHSRKYHLLETLQVDCCKHTLSFLMF
uniref:Uncharacterized protein n=1 Tax=Arundo donax TaxID=35708 RepID=A0A0A9F1C2_ARUDO